MVDFCPAVENICIKRGDSPVMRVLVTEDGSVSDISGYSFVLTVDTSPAPSDSANNQFSLSSGVIVDGASGIVTFQPSTTDTDIPPSVYFYDLQMVTSLPSTRTILEGRFEVKQDITKV